MQNNKFWKKNSRYCVISVAFFVYINLFSNSASADTLSNSVQQKFKSPVLNSHWQNIVKKGRNQDVYFYAWGGDSQINAYIQWVVQQVKNQYNINLHHVKLSDTSEAVSRVLAEKSANNSTNGSVDLVWINGANFAAMSEHSLLLKQWANMLPNFRFTNPDNNPAVLFDFGIPTQGMEAPWGQASLTFYYDSVAINQSNNNDAAISKIPLTLSELLTWSQQNPGRFSYPKPPDFLGLSFLKYALIVLHENSNEYTKNQLNSLATSNNTDEVLAPLWQFLNKLHPTLWRKGEYFVQSGLQMRRLVDDTELSLAFTFSSPDIPAAVRRFDLPRSIRSYAMNDGSLSNTHFVAIPYNSSSAQAAQLVANFLLSPEAQAHKQKSNVWGDRSVLIQSTLGSKQQALFQSQTIHPSALPLGSIKRSLNEPHPSWVKVITEGWQTRYGVTP